MKEKTLSVSSSASSIGFVEPDADEIIRIFYPVTGKTVEVRAGDISI